jgi:rubrerythrin
MSPRDIRQRVRWTCRFKKRYMTEREVMEGFMRIPEKAHEGLEAYICPCCGYMHLGHRVKWAHKMERAFA